LRNVDDKLSYISTTCGVGFVLTTIGEKLFEVAETHPDNIAYIFHQNNGLKLSFVEVKNRAVRLAQNFLHIGLKKGDRIATLIPSTHELVICYLAAALTGLVVVPLEQDYGSFELEYMIQKTDPSAIVVCNEGEFESTVNELFPDINSYEKGNYRNNKFGSLRNLIFLNKRNESSNNAWAWSDMADGLLNRGPLYEFPAINSEDDYAIIFTVKKLNCFFFKYISCIIIQNYY
jgi:acyl-CoA synthetase (AMP-forming)/AMP-acid ligase II